MRRSAALLLYYPNHTFIGSDRKPVQYQWLPRRLLLVRHGESEANVNREVYSNTPDWRITLTERGKDQAFDCGRRLRRIIGNEKIYIYYSPYMRTRQTLEEIRKSLDDAQIQGEREDERLREQEMGNYQPIADMDDTWAARNRFSRLYYRFPSGESSADVGDRVSSFFDSLLRERIGLTVPNMNEGIMSDASEEVAWLGLGRWKGKEGGEMGDGTPVRTADTSNPWTLTAGAASKDRSGRPCQGANGDYRKEGMRAHSSGAAGSPSADPQGRVNTGAVSLTLPTVQQQQQQQQQRTEPAFTCDADLDSSVRSVSELAAAMDRGVLPPNDLGAATGDDQNVIIVAHGLLIRLFIGRWFRVPMEVFETMCNPPNCSITVLERHDGLNRLVMTDVSKQLFGSDPLLQMMRFDGREDTQWYRERFLGIIDPVKDAQRSMQAEDDDENHYSRSKTPHEYEPPANLRDYPPVPRPRCASSSTTTTATSSSNIGVIHEKGRRMPAGPSSGQADADRARAHSGGVEHNAAAGVGAGGGVEGGAEAVAAETVWPLERAYEANAVENAESCKTGGDREKGHREGNGAASPAAAMSASASQPWTFELAGGHVPNVGRGEDTAEMKQSLQKYLSRGFW